MFEGFMLQHVVLRSVHVSLVWLYSIPASKLIHPISTWQAATSPADVVPAANEMQEAPKMAADMLGRKDTTQLEAWLT